MSDEMKPKHGGRIVPEGEWFLWGGDMVLQAGEGGAEVTPGTVVNAKDVCRLPDPGDCDEAGDAVDCAALLLAAPDMKTALVWAGDAIRHVLDALDEGVEIDASRLRGAGAVVRAVLATADNNEQARCPHDSTITDEDGTNCEDCGAEVAA